MRRLRFLCFNIHGGRNLAGKRDIARINGLLEKLDIDVGVFQEMETRPARGGRAGDVALIAGSSRPHHLSGPSYTQGEGWYGNLIVSRYPILRGLVHNLETKATLEPRNAVDALLDTPLGKLRLIGTHLSLSIFERWSEARNLLRLIKAVEETERLPLFLMGDINEWQRPSRLLRYLDAAMTPLPCAATFPSFLPFLKLDRVWQDAPQFKVTAHRIKGPDVGRMSDHLPLLVEVSPIS